MRSKIQDMVALRLAAAGFLLIGVLLKIIVFVWTMVKLIRKKIVV
jgi:hypothetical protein